MKIKIGDINLRTYNEICNEYGKDSSKRPCVNNNNNPCPFRRPDLLACKAMKDEYCDEEVEIPDKFLDNCKQMIDAKKATQKCKLLPTLDEEALRSLGIAVKNFGSITEEFYKSILEAHDSLKELKEKMKEVYMEEYKQRMVNEYRELKERHTRLCAILERRRAGVLDFTLTCPVGLLEEQEKAMRAYMDVLKRRAVFEHIDLEKETLADGTIEH